MPFKKGGGHHKGRKSTRISLNVTRTFANTQCKGFALEFWVEETCILICCLRFDRHAYTADPLRRRRRRRDDG